MPISALSVLNGKQIVMNTWLRQYNQILPHQALNMRQPVRKTGHQSGQQKWD